MVVKSIFKNNKGFTLIELLAVIVILVIIAVIATPIITNIIEIVKKSSFERSVEGIVKGLELDVAFKLDENGYTYEVKDGEIIGLDKDANISVSNTKGYNGIIRYDSASNVSYAIYNDLYCIIEINNEKTIKNYINNNCTLFYKNGDIIYYDVLNGKTCTNYHIDNSKLGYNGVTKTTINQTSCLKFYSFNDNIQIDKVNLLLDHNIDKSKWSDTSNEPATILNKLKEAVTDWVGTITPQNYLLSQEEYGNYEIKYQDENYKARLITASEIAEITGHPTFNESISIQSNWFYFDTNKNVKKDTCKNGDISGCNFGWLYDRTSKSCTSLGCLNDSDSETFGYWTATFVNGSSNYAWYVFGGGYLSSDIITRVIGIRPVIEVKKINL